MKKRIFRIPQPVLAAPLKPKIPEKIISTTATIAKIQKILIFSPFMLVNRFILNQYYNNYFQAVKYFSAQKTNGDSNNDAYKLLEE